MYIHGLYIYSTMYCTLSGHPLRIVKRSDCPMWKRGGKGVALKCNTRKRGVFSASNASSSVIADVFALAAHVCQMPDLYVFRHRELILPVPDLEGQGICQR